MIDRRGKSPSLVRNAVIGIALILIGSYFAVTKSLPFNSEFELKAVFQNAAKIREKSPVRIAGVNVGEVKSVEAMGDDAAEVTFTVSDDGLPIHDDATAEIRPRIFLEGNFFLDLRPGSPSGDELADGGTIPISHTSTAVQLDQVLTALQGPEREGLQKLLQGYGTALNGEPTAADDRSQDPDVRGETAGESINDSFTYGGPAGRDSSIVNDALQGTQPHDLSRLIAAQATVFDALLERERQLQDLVTNFNTTAGAFASESGNLSESIRLLAPTLERAEPALRHTSDSFPALRAYARELEPGVAELPGVINAAGPWLKQAKALMGDDELGYLANQLRTLAPAAAAGTAAGKGFFTQVELTSRCFDQVLFPTGDVVLDDDGLSTGVPNYKEFFYAASNIAGETSSFDGNGPYLRFQTGNGPVNVKGAQPGGGFQNDFLYGRSAVAPVGTRPVAGAGNQPPYRTDKPCYQNAIPDLNGPASDIGPPSPALEP